MLHITLPCVMLYRTKIYFWFKYKDNFFYSNEINYICYYMVHILKINTLKMFNHTNIITATHHVENTIMIT